MHSYINTPFVMNGLLPSLAIQKPRAMVPSLLKAQDEGSGFRVQGLGFRVQGLGFRHVPSRLNVSLHSRVQKIR